MKKFSLFIASLVLFASCGGWAVDFAPINFYIGVVNSDGVDLLNSENEDALDLSKIVLHFEGKSYMLNPEETRAYLAIFSGMELRKYDNQNFLYVGEFDGGNNVENREFVIEWGDGTSDSFSYTNKVGVKSVRKRRFYHNGKQVDSKYITVVKPM